MALLALTSQVLGHLFVTTSLPLLPSVVGSILLFVQPAVTLAVATILPVSGPRRCSSPASPWSWAGSSAPPSPSNGGRGAGVRATMDASRGVPEPAVEASEMGTQFVVQLQNRPGALAGLARALAEADIDIRDISGGGAGDHAYTVFTTSDDAATRRVLRSMGVPHVEGETLIVEVEDRPGCLAAVAEKLAAAGVDIRGVLFVGRAGGMVETAFSVDDVVRARKALGLEQGPGAEPGRSAGSGPG